MKQVLRIVIASLGIGMYALLAPESSAWSLVFLAVGAAALYSAGWHEGRGQ